MKENKRIIHILIAMCLLFFSLIGYLTYFEVFVKDEVIAHSSNKRQWDYYGKRIRGSILDKNGELLAYSEGDVDEQKRIYPHDDLYSHVVGYHSPKYGSSLVEGVYSQMLNGETSLQSLFDLKDQLFGQRVKGHDVYLTIDHSLQKKASELMGDRNGVILAMNPESGSILAMVSKPDFNPNEDWLDAHWESLLEDKNAPLLSRATQGLYPPGSTFKILTAVTAIENNQVKEQYQDQSKLRIDGKDFHNYNDQSYGTMTLKEAFARSSNTIFASMAVELGQNLLLEQANRVGFNQSLPFVLGINTSTFPSKTMEKTDLAAAGIGQGEVLMTPFHLAMITSSVVHSGTMMEPKIVDHVVSDDGRTFYQSRPAVFREVMSSATAAEIRKMMILTVEEGTGTKARIKNVTVGGKTGTAENVRTDTGENDTHAWFTGFGDNGEDRIVLTVLMEHSGSTGGQLAAPIAKDLMETYFQELADNK